MHAKRFLLTMVFLTISCVLFSTPSRSTAYGIDNYSNEDIKLTVVPKFEQERGTTPEKRVDYYNRDGKFELTLTIIECTRREKELLQVYHEAQPPYYDNVKSGVTLLDLANLFFF